MIFAFNGLCNVLSLNCVSRDAQCAYLSGLAQLAVIEVVCESSELAKLFIYVNIACLIIFIIAYYLRFCLLIGSAKIIVVFP